MRIVLVVLMLFMGAASAQANDFFPGIRAAQRARALHQAQQDFFDAQAARDLAILRAQQARALRNARNFNNFDYFNSFQRNLFFGNVPVHSSRDFRNFRGFDSCY